ncbi:MAG: phosphonate C-P lyase system protein PhnG [Roseomonas sp.]|nr:phosphonate C-P lyase system protein PhnG [Roseomonas sp.]MCA3329522.1 phosphonate C-P lyase system protein PhnG [Roseomonas sp.]MCA3333476.1 phosphonate C-P lyase system protein PhnG [Roseomonas sp.]MCA3354101.1 phosphonate C-P lyase system protein PhnG [Roseomonas sp.]MCA3361273.1 phosphonate C-P lyase system protein PhnG [Roseomonas sp.]
MTQTDTPSSHAARQKWMSILARASAEELSAALAALPHLPEAEILRAPETGLVMVRGRAGGDGDAFNLGEMTVTRCALRLGAHIGHAYVAGRDHAKARLAALLDAALQDSALYPACMQAVIEPLAAAQQEARAAEARKAAATRVDFFTMATMR